MGPGFPIRSAVTRDAGTAGTTQPRGSDTSMDVERARPSVGTDGKRDFALRMGRTDGARHDISCDRPRTIGRITLTARGSRLCARDVQCALSGARIGHAGGAMARVDLRDVAERLATAGDVTAIGNIVGDACEQGLPFGSFGWAVIEPRVTEKPCMVLRSNEFPTDWLAERFLAILPAIERDLGGLMRAISEPRAYDGFVKFPVETLKDTERPERPLATDLLRPSDRRAPLARRHTGRVLRRHPLPKGTPVRARRSPVHRGICASWRIERFVEWPRWEPMASPPRLKPFPRRSHTRPFSSSTVAGSAG